MQKNYSQLFLGIIIGLVLGLLIGKLLIPKPNNITETTQHSTTSNQPAVENNYPNANIQHNHSSNDEGNYNGNVSIPSKVHDVLKYIKANNKAMDGYVGGRIFTNREKVLPMQDERGNSIDYQEWDINQKIEGQNRGTERIVTGSDGRSWYTNDHYKSFTLIK